MQSSLKMSTRQSPNAAAACYQGLNAVEGKFGPGECVSCVDPAGREFARGLVNYSAAELEKIKGLHSAGIESVLGYKLTEEVIHRDDLVLI